VSSATMAAAVVVALLAAAALAIRGKARRPQ
jgi:hypothetical protein